ncbi:Fur family transcriptional regulator [Bifidobacterium aquikefiri]|uniref:Fur family transcriptional regulator n=2 Tax=Bifidobacterium aquikefiri TaxID=1653207 RepID=A0A261G727_9BIFI|nr:Fur family transcriptional regulator [Bifidobacterium aquikefiri]OZG67219.1 Fur family transcriptional regulator [Bifidobacterium aquikefiri]
MQAQEEERVIHTNLDEVLHDRGLRTTPQRKLIYRIITATAQHVSAQQIQQELEDVFPGISLPTVYSTLELFTQLGVIHKMAINDGEMLYDTGWSHPHAHMKCRQCGRIFDLDIPPVTQKDIQSAAKAGFNVDSGDLLLHGLCKECAAKESQKAGA